MSAADRSPGGGAGGQGGGRQNAKAPVFPVGPAGRRELRRALVRSTNPSDTIQKFQQSHSLHSMMSRAFGTTPLYEADAEAAKTKTRSKSKDQQDDATPEIPVEKLETDSALSFLSHLGVSQYEVHKRVGDTLLKHLEVEIKKTNSQEPLLNLLKSCWGYSTTIPELRPVLWSVLKQLGKDTPTPVLKALGEQEENGDLKHAEIFKPLPPLLKRLVWETDWEDKITLEMSEEMEPKAFLEQAKSTLLGHTIWPHLKKYCQNEYLVTNANQPFVAGARDRRIPTNHRRALNTLSTTTSSAANPAASGSTSPKAPGTLSSFTSRSGTGTGAAATAAGTAAAIEKGITSGKSIASLRQLLSDPTGGSAAFRPKLLYAILSILIAEHGSMDDNLMGCADHLHCTLVADLLLSATVGLPKAYQQVLRLASALDESVKAGVLKDTAIVKIQACLKDIFPPGPVDPSKGDGKDKKLTPAAKSKLDKKAVAAKNSNKSTPGKTAYNLLEPTTAFKRQLSRIIHECLTAMKDADPQSLFLNPVTDAIAPGYSKVITTPMCIMEMKEKIDDHDYKTLQEWEEDVKLMFQNCITYNRGAAGAWFRGEAQRQKKVFKEEVLPQARRLYEKEVSLRTKIEDVDMSRKRKQPGDPLPNTKGKPGLAASLIQPLPAVLKNADPAGEAKPPAAAAPEAGDSKEKDKVYPSMPALASMLLADPFVVRLLLDRILRSLRLDVIRGKSLPTGHDVIPSLLQILHMSQWSNQVCAVRGKQYIIPGGGITAPEEDEPSAEEFLMQTMPFESLRKYIPMLSQLFLENALDQRVVAGGDLYDAFKSMEEARPPPPSPEAWKDNNMQGIVALVEGALVHVCRPDNTSEASLAITYPKFASVLQEASSTICDDQAFFSCLIESLLKHKNKLQRSARDAVVEQWLVFLRTPPRNVKRKKGLSKKQKKWGTITSAAHECLMILLNEWAALGNQLLPRDMLLKFSSDAVQAAEESETLAERKFVALWNQSNETKEDEEDTAYGDFTPIRKQYERMLNSLPDNYRTQWREQVGLADEEVKDVEMEEAKDDVPVNAEEKDAAIKTEEIDAAEDEMADEKEESAAVKTEDD